MNPAKTRLLKKFVLEGQLNGGDLNEKNLASYTAACRKIEQEKMMFQDKVDKAKELFHHTITDAQVVRDFPSELLRATAVDRYVDSVLNGI